MTQEVEQQVAVVLGEPDVAAVEPSPRGGSGVAALMDPVGHATSVRRPQRPRLVVWFAAGWLILMVVLCLTADLLPLKEYGAPSDVASQRPGFRLSEPLGTDFLGRSLLSRSIYGARVSLAVGVGAVLVGLFIGGTLGVIAGYFRGKVDTLFNIFISAFLAFPPLVLLLAITAFMTPKISTLIAALAVLSTPAYARLARANTLSVAQREFIRAARSMGARRSRVILREIVPNIALPLLSYSFIVIAAVMIAEGSLSFLGLGIPPPTPSWGGMVASGRQFLQTDPHEVIVPAVLLLLTVFSFNAVGDNLRRHFDARESVL